MKSEPALANILLSSPIKVTSGSSKILIKILIKNHFKAFILPTTFKYILCPTGCAVEIWHSKYPSSSFLACFICEFSFTKFVFLPKQFWIVLKYLQCPRWIEFVAKYLISLILRVSQFSHTQKIDVSVSNPWDHISFQIHYWTYQEGVFATLNCDICYWYRCLVKISVCPGWWRLWSVIGDIRGRLPRLFITCLGIVNARIWCHTRAYNFDTTKKNDTRFKIKVFFPFYTKIWEGFCVKLNSLIYLSLFVCNFQKRRKLVLRHFKLEGITNKIL